MRIESKNNVFFSDCSHLFVKENSLYHETDQGLCMYMYVSVCIYVCMYLRMYVCMYIYVCMYVGVYMCHVQLLRCLCLLQFVTISTFESMIQCKWINQQSSFLSWDKMNITSYQNQSMFRNSSWHNLLNYVISKTRTNKIIPRQKQIVTLPGVRCYLLHASTL